MKLAAEHRYGLMAAPPFPLAGIAESVRLYRAAARECDPRLVLIRFYHLAATREDAIAEARVFLQPFVDRMRVTTAKMQPEWTPWMVLERLIEDSLIGTLQDVGEKIAAIKRDLGPRSLILKPLSPDFQKRKQDLRVFAEKIKPAFVAKTESVGDSVAATAM